MLSDTETKFGAPKAEIFAVVTFVENYRAYLGNSSFKLRVDNIALSWLKMYSMDQSYNCRWIVRLDGYHMIKKVFSFLGKETYEALPLTSWLDKSRHQIPGHPELPVEEALEIKIFSKKDPVTLDLSQRSKLVQQELSRMIINSLSLLDKTVQVTP